MQTTRRAFFTTAFALGAGFTALARAIEPIRRTGPARLQPSLAAYSFNQYLSLSAKTPAMTLEEFIDFTARQDLPAVELTAYYFRKTDEEYIKAIRSRCDRNKLAVSGTAVGNDFCWPDKTKRAEQLDMVKRWIEHTARLGGKTMRIFAGSVKKGDKESDALKRAIDTIEQACEYAGQHKVILALENHGGVTATAEQMLAIVKAVKSDWFGVNMDTGNFRTADPYADLEKIAPYAVVAQVKTEIFPGGKREEADLKRLTAMLRKVGFQGYVALEYEAKEDPKTAVPRYLTELKKYMG